MSSITKGQLPPLRTAPFDQEPGFYEEAGLWLYGNARILRSELALVKAAIGPNEHSTEELNAIEAEAEEIVLGGKVLVCGVHNAAQRRAAVVPLRWGAPRIVVFSGGFKYHLGEDLDNEPFRAARLWRCWKRRVSLWVLTSGLRIPPRRSSRRRRRKSPTRKCRRAWTGSRRVPHRGKRSSRWPGRRTRRRLS